MKMFALDMRAYESSFAFLGTATADSFFKTSKKKKDEKPFFKKRKTICLSKILSTFLYERTFSCQGELLPSLRGISLQCPT